MFSNWFHKLSQRILQPSLCWTLPIKGIYFYDTDSVENHGLLTSGATVTLTPEPDNEFDSQAVQIWLKHSPDTLAHATQHQPCLLGYIPRSHSRRITWLLRHTQLKTAEIESAYRQYHRLYIYIHLQFTARWWQAIQYWIQ